MSNTIFLTGSSGSVGSSILQEFHKMLSSRNPPNIKIKGQYKNIKGNEVQRIKSSCSHTEPVECDYNDQEALTEAMKGCNTVFVLTGYTVDMLVHGRKIIDAGIDAGAKHFVHLGVPQYYPWPDKVNFSNWHLELEKYIEVGGFNSVRGIEWTHLRPEFFTNNLINYNGVSFIKEGKVTWPVKPSIAHPWVCSEDIAPIAAAVLASPKQHKDKIYPITSFVASTDQIAQALSKKLNKQFIAEPDHINNVFNQLVKLGNDPVYMTGIKEGVNVLNGMREGSKVEAPDTRIGMDVVKGLTNRSPLGIDQWIDIYKEQLMKL